MGDCRCKKLVIPYYPQLGDNKVDYNIATYWEKLVADYMRISLVDVEKLEYISYLEIRRDAFIERLRQTEAGREYLDNAFRIKQTKLDRSALRNKLGHRKEETQKNRHARILFYI